jgi:hypothetical protein
MTLPTNLRKARRIVRSVTYRRRLLEELPELEAEIIALVQEYGLNYLDGYRIEVVEGKLYLEKLPAQDLKQLKLFEEDEARAS